MIHQDPEDAFAVEAESTIVLRVLSGVQRGAEMPLRSASYVLGSGDDVDIVLADGSLKSSHVSLTISNGDVSVQALEGEVVVGDQVLQPGEGAPLEMPAAMVVGMLVVGMGDEATDWASVPIPDPMQRPEPDPEPEPDPGQADVGAADEMSVEELDSEAETAPEGAEAPEQDGDGEPADAETTEDAAAISDEAEAAETAEDAPRTAEAEVTPAASAQAAASAPAGSRKRMLGAMAAVAVIAVIFVLYEQVFSPSDDNTGTGVSGEAVVEPETRAREILAGMELAEVKLIVDANGGLRLTGLVETQDQRDALDEALKGAGIVVDDRVRVVERMMEAVRITLASVTWPESNYEDHLVVRYQGKGQITIDGFLGPQVDKSVLRRRLEGDVPGLADLRFVRSDLRDWRAIMVHDIEEAGLTDWLKTSVVGDQIRVEGELTASQARIWRDVGEKFVEQSRGRPRIQIGVSALPDRGPAPAVEPPPTVEDPVIGRPQISLIGVVLSSDGENIALLSDGGLLRVGDRLATGAVVKEVKLDRMILMAGNEEYVYRIKEKP